MLADMNGRPPRTFRTIYDEPFRKRLGDHLYVNTGPEHMPLGLADRRAHDQRLAERGERDES